MPGLLGNPALWSLTEAKVLMFLLVLLRLGGLLATMPGFGQTRVPLQVRVLLGLTLTFVITPMVGQPTLAVANLYDLLGLMFSEMAAGAIMGLSIAWIVESVAYGGQLMDTQMGFSFVQFLDPVSAHPVAISGAFLTNVTMMLILVSGLHHQMIRALVESYRILPMGMPVAVDPRLVLVQAGMIIVRGFQLAFPVLFVLFMVDFTAGIAGKFMPQLHLITLTFPLKIFIGLTILGILLREFPSWIGPVLEAAPREALRLLVHHG